MDLLLHGVAEFCSLRDRDAIESAFVGLVLQAAQGQVRCARFVQLVGDPDDQRCRVTVEQAWQHAPVVASRTGMDWHRFPALALAPQRQQACLLGSASLANDAVHLYVVALEAPPMVARMLELESAAVLPLECMARIDALVRIYKSLESLLDYGERDTLTELLNRKTFDGAFQKVSNEQLATTDETHPDRRHLHVQEGYWLAVLDIDHFKKVNDEFGHLIGDEVLLLLARTMRASFRFHDQLYRFGGEEFVVMMRCVKQADAIGALERFRLTVQEHSFPQVGHITVSIGCAALQADDTPSVAFDRADKAVYFAKGNGRNQVCDYDALVAEGRLQESAPESKEADFF